MSTPPAYLNPCPANHCVALVSVLAMGGPAASVHVQRTLLLYPAKISQLLTLVP